MAEQDVNMKSCFCALNCKNCKSMKKIKMEKVHHINQNICLFTDSELQQPD